MVVEVVEVSFCFDITYARNDARTAVNLVRAVMPSLNSHSSLSHAILLHSKTEGLLCTQRG